MSDVSKLLLRVAQLERAMRVIWWTTSDPTASDIVSSTIGEAHPSVPGPRVVERHAEMRERAEKAEAEVARLREALKVAQAAMSAMQGGARTSDEIAGVLGLTPPAEQVKGRLGSSLVTNPRMAMPYVGKSMDRKRNARRRQLSGAHTAVSWNAAYPVGTAVRYWPIYPPSEGFPPEDTTTRSEAWTLGDGSVVVLVSGKAGGVHLSHIEVLP